MVEFEADRMRHLVLTDAVIASARCLSARGSCRRPSGGDRNASRRRTELGEAALAGAARHNAARLDVAIPAIAKTYHSAPNCHGDLAEGAPPTTYRQIGWRLHDG